MSKQRQKNRLEQEELAFPAESRSDAPKAAAQGTETQVAKRKSACLSAFHVGGRVHPQRASLKRFRERISLPFINTPRFPRVVEGVDTRVQIDRPLSAAPEMENLGC